MNSTTEMAWALIIIEGRTVSGGKGATSVADQQRGQELQMQQAAFNTQQQQLAMLNKSFSPFLSGTQGFSPQLLATMRSQFLNSNSQTFNNAGNQVRAALGARGEGTGSAPVGGTYGSGISNLMAAQAGSQSQGLLGINAANAQQALSNQFNAGNILSGNAATLTGTQGVAGAGASSALGSYINASNSGFMGSLENAAGSAFGKGLGTGLSGGLGTFMNSFGMGGK
jgi:hypothetical protein